MPAQMDFEEEVIRRQRERAAAERRERNARAIAEVVGRNPAKPLEPPSDFFKRLRDRNANNN
jgi:hypothetical protein